MENYFTKQRLEKVIIPRFVEMVRERLLLMRVHPDQVPISLPKFVQILGANPEMVKGWIRKGLLPVCRYNGKIWIMAGDIRKIFQQQFLLPAGGDVGPEFWDRLKEF